MLGCWGGARGRLWVCEARPFARASRTAGEDTLGGGVKALVPPARAPRVARNRPCAHSPQAWTSGLTLSDYEQHAAANTKTVEEMKALAAR